MAHSLFDSRPVNHVRHLSFCASLLLRINNVSRSTVLPSLLWRVGGREEVINFEKRAKTLFVALSSFALLLTLSFVDIHMRERSLKHV